MVPNTEVLSRMKVGTPVLLKKIMCRQCQFFGQVARGSGEKELRECIRSSDKKIGRGRRKIGWIDTVSEITGEKGIEKNLKLAEKRLEWKRVKDFECNNNEP